jgi:RNA polymerase sigma-70 factor (ECF subfamily)
MARGQAMTDPGPSSMPAVPAPSGLEAVYLDHRTALVRFLRARGAGDRAEDLVQELWLRIVSTPSGPVFDPLNYLFRAANNLMLNRLRTEKRDEARDEAWTEVHRSGPGSSADAALVARQEIAQARQRLTETGTRVQEVFFLFRVEGMSQRDIAERFGVSLSAVEKDIQRAYRAIAALKDEADA